MRQLRHLRQLHISSVFSVMRIAIFAILSQVTRASQDETNYLPRFSKKHAIKKPLTSTVVRVVIVETYETSSISLYL